MISDEMLRAAASGAGAALLASLPDDVPCTPPLRFERHMRRLIRRAEHPILFPVLRAAACFTLAVLLGGSLLLTSVPEARAAFFGWVEKHLPNMIVYSFSERESVKPSEIAYRPAFIPDGYQEIVATDRNGHGSIVYQNESGQYLTFTYDAAYSNANSHLITDSAIHQFTQVDKMQADLYLHEDGSSSNSIAWSDPITNVLFIISYWGEEETLVRIAESVSEYLP